VTVHGSRADGTLITAERDLAEERQVAQALLAQVPALVSLDLLASEAPRVVHGEDAIALVAALQAEGDAGDGGVAEARRPLARAPHARRRRSSAGGARPRLSRRTAR
jgi:hypothetical protein